MTLAQAAAWASLAVGMVLVEVLLAPRRSRPPVATAILSNQLIQSATAASLLTGMVGSLVLPWAGLPVLVSLPVGIAVGAAGLLLRALAMRSLGPFYTLTPGVESGQELITSGPYSWVRHPGYVGMLLQVLGLQILIGTPIALLASLFVVAAFPVRIAVEERMLLEHFGAQYKEYQHHTRFRLVPGIF